jgi:hypothetical protein
VVVTVEAEAAEEVMAPLGAQLQERAAQEALALA